MRRFFVAPLIVLALILAMPTVTVTAGPRAAPSSTVRAPAAAPQSTTPFFPNIDIIDGSSPFVWQVEPTMVVNRAGTVFAGWKETDGAENRGLRVASSYSVDGGASWAPNILMNQSHPSGGCSNSDPWMALAPDDRVHFAYLEYNCATQGLDVSNTTNGQDWGTVHFANGAGGLTDKDSAWVDASGRIYAAWDEGNVMDVTWSDDNGSNWKRPFVDPDDSPGGVLGVLIATAANGTVYVSWWDFGSNDILFDWSADRGATWHTDKRVNSQPGSAPGSGWVLAIPAMVVDQTSGAIYISWTDSRNGNFDIFASSSTDGGLTWSANRRVNDDTATATQYMVDLAVDSAGVVHAAWEDKRNGNWNIFYSNSSDGGSTWTSNLRVSDVDTPGSYNRPGDYLSIEAGPGDAIYVVWTDGRGADFDIYFARSPGFPSATVGFATSPVGRTIVVDNKTVKPPVQYTWILGSTHTILAPSPQSAGVNARYVWTNWSDGGAQMHDVVATSDMTLNATFGLQYHATVDVATAGPEFIVDGVSYTAAVAFWWDAGSPHVLDAPSPQLVPPSHRYVWTSWSDGGARTHGVVANAPFAAVASFQEEWTFLVQTSPPGRSVLVDGVSYPGPSSIWLPPGTDHVVSVDLIQPGATGVRYVFSSWSDGGASTHVITITGTMSLTASFDTEYYLTVASTVPGAQGSGWFAAGSTPTASVATVIVDVASGERLAFTGWGTDASGAGTTSDPITMNGPKTATALYETQFFLSVQSVGSASGSGWYSEGASATATIPSGQIGGADTRQVFTGWSGAASGTSTTSNPITMDAPKTAVANWRTEYLVTIVSDVSGVQGGGWYAAGSSATLTAPAQGTSGGQTVTFAGWSGDASSSGLTVTVTVDRPLTVRASWAAPGSLASPLVVGGLLALLVIAALLAFLFIVWRRRRKEEKR